MTDAMIKSILDKLQVLQLKLKFYNARHGAKLSEKNAEDFDLAKNSVDDWVYVMTNNTVDSKLIVLMMQAANKLNRKYRP